jgi:hypothetical protein
MRRATVDWFVILALLWVLAGCAAQFSPSVLRQEIVRQRGEDPLSVFEINVGQFTTLLLRQSLAGTGGELPFAGVRELQVAVFEAPAVKGPVIDVTQIATRGWEAVVKVHDQERSGMVLLRDAEGSSWNTPNAKTTIGDLVAIGAGRRSVVFARLKGRLSPELPAALGEVVRRGGPDQLRKLFMQLSDDAIGP